MQKPILMPKAAVCDDANLAVDSDTFRSRKHLYHPEAYEVQRQYVAAEEIRRADLPDMQEKHSCRYASFEATKSWKRDRY